MSEAVGSNTFMFQDCKEVYMFCNKYVSKTPVARLQPELLCKQSIPPLLPPYNTFMGGVNRTAHMRKTQF